MRPSTQAFVKNVVAIREINAQARLRNEHVQTIHVANIGGVLSAAYEHLRKAAEYTEDHLLLQNAVKRFYARLAVLRDQSQYETSGGDLVIELTLAGYLENDTVSVIDVAEIDRLAGAYLRFYESLERSSENPSRYKAWSLDVLAVAVEQILNPHAQNDAYIQFAYDHFAETIDAPRLFNGQRPPEFNLALYIALQRGLLKSDEATIRAGLLNRFKLTPEDHSYIALNKQIDELLTHSVTDKLFRYINKNGAPFRILYRMLENDEQFLSHIEQQSVFMDAYQRQIEKEYSEVTTRINRGVWRSIIFLLITKALIGLLIEVPYDIAVHGQILWLALAVNLLFPPLYMILLRLTLKTPPHVNTLHLADEMERILYESSPTIHSARATAPAHTPVFSRIYNVVYAATFIAIFGAVAYVLWRFFQFEWIHLIIFFVFISTASFLGFRLSRQIRDIEAISNEQGGAALVRDILYMPFVAVGQWVSEKYAKINVVAMVLDMVIELPMKIILRLIRQWSLFLKSKQDQL